MQDESGHAFEEERLDSWDFKSIEAAVLQTERGRWFLGEYARRLRAREHARIEAALARIEERLPSPPGPAREAETQIVALSVHQRLVDIATALRARGIDEESCARIEAQANALVDLALSRKSAAAPRLRESTPPQGAPPRRLGAV